MSGLTEDETEQDTSRLTAHESAAKRDSARPTLVYATPTASAAFVSQILATEERGSPSRGRRNTALVGAIGAYWRGARISERRMPQGYRKSVVA